MFKKTQIFYEVFLAKAGYGKGFWTLLAGIAVALLFLLQLENGRSHPIVERLPASEFQSR